MRSSEQQLSFGDTIAGDTQARMAWVKENNLGQMLPSTIVPLFVDLQGLVAQAADHAGLLAMLVRAMSTAALRQRDLALPSLARQDLAADPFPYFDEWLDCVERVLADRTGLLMLDEFEVLQSGFDDRRFSLMIVKGRDGS